MMKLDKRRLLAVLLAATAAIAMVGPATAAAAVWKDGGKEVTTTFELGLTGGSNYEINESAGGVNCEEHMTLSSTGKSNATISKFENKSCKTFGSLASCTVSTVEAIGLPWSITLGASTETITSMHVKHKFKTGCATTEINETLNVTMTPVKKEGTGLIQSFELLGTASKYKQFGSYSIDSPNSGTYEIG
jgi:hypothetical protein